MFVLTLAVALCCVKFIYPILCLVMASGDRDQLYPLGPTDWAFTWKRRQNSVSEMLCFINRMDNVQKLSNCNTIVKTFRLYLNKHYGVRVCRTRRQCCDSQVSSVQEAGRGVSSGTRWNNSGWEQRDIKILTGYWRQHNCSKTLQYIASNDLTISDKWIRNYVEERCRELV